MKNGRNTQVSRGSRFAKPPRTPAGERFSAESWKRPTQPDNAPIAPLAQPRRTWILRGQAPSRPRLKPTPTIPKGPKYPKDVPPVQPDTGAIGAMRATAPSGAKYVLRDKRGAPPPFKKSESTDTGSLAQTTAKPSATRNVTYRKFTIMCSAAHQPQKANRSTPTILERNGKADDSRRASYPRPRRLRSARPPDSDGSLSAAQPVPNSAP